MLSNIGQLTEAVRRKSYGVIFAFAVPQLDLITSLAVILLDELEKAHKVAKYLSAPGQLAYACRMSPCYCFKFWTRALSPTARVEKLTLGCVSIPILHLIILHLHA